MKAAPNGFFAEGLILFGALEKGGVAAKGYVLQPPDLRGGSVSNLNAYQDKIRALLAHLSPGMRVQFQWTSNCDYKKELTRYFRETARVTHPHIKRVREERFQRYWDRMHRRDLRRENLVMFITTDITRYSGSLKTRAGLQQYYAQLLAQLRGQFDELTNTLRTIFSSDTTVSPMTDQEHFAYCKKFLNPSLADRFDMDFEEQFNPRLSLQENCWNSDGVSVPKVGFYLDGRYHTIYTLKRWPSRTYPGIVARLTGLPFLDYQLTVNIEPLPSKKEVEKEEKAIERLRGEYEDTERHSLLVAIGKKEKKIESLSTGFINAFAVTYIIRVWDENEAALSAKCAAIKNAINLMGGAQYYECALPSTAKKLFFASWPGWTGSSYKHRNLYAEDAYLADMLPFSATFTGHLAEAEALYDGSQNNLVGLRTFIGNPPSPQHTVLIGATGAGKSVHMRDFLEQTAGYYHYSVIIEEGLSYEPFTRAMGERPIIIHPDGDLTINYFDTGKLPLGQLQLATAVALVSRMIGEAPDVETQQIRQALLAQYIHQLYEDTFEEWSKRHRDLLPGIERMACATHRWRHLKMTPGATDMEAFAELRDRVRSNDDEAQQFIAHIGEGEITKFLKQPQTERALMAMAHSHYRPEDYPVHASLVELMQFSRMPEHKKEEIDHLATLLSAWTAHGHYGRLFDGATNISLTGNIAHFELGYIPEQAMELKTAAGLLITGFSRQHIISLPRAQWKRIIFEELARFLDIAKWVESIEQLKTQIDQMKQQVSIQGDLRKWTGNPMDAAKKVALDKLGVSELVREYGQARATIVATASSLASLGNTANGTFRAIENTDLDGGTLVRDELIHRRYSVLDAQLQNYQQVVTDTKARELELQQDLADTLADLKDADTDAEVRKQTAKIEAINGQLATINAARRDQADQVMAQKIANDARLEQERLAAAELEAKNENIANQRVTTFMRTLKVRQNSP